MADIHHSLMWRVSRLTIYIIDTAYAQNWEDGKWYNFDDAHVSEVNANDAKVRLYTCMICDAAVD